MVTKPNGGAAAPGPVAPESDNARGQAGVIGAEAKANGHESSIVSNETLFDSNGGASAAGAINGHAVLRPSIPTQCPAQLRSLKAWLLWRHEANSNKPNAKPRKVPYYVDGGRRTGEQGSPEDRAQLATFDAAIAAAARRGMDGVGLALLPGQGLTVLDLDGCLTGTGLHPEAAALCEGTYAEYSPSGGGVHAFYWGVYGDRKDAHGEPFGLESFSSKGYVTFTGNALPGVEDLELTGVNIQVLLPKVRIYCDRRFARSGTSTAAAPTDTSDPLDSYSPPVGMSIEELRDALRHVDASLGYEEWVQVGMGIHHETNGSDEGFALWDQWSATASNYESVEFNRERWDSFGRRGGRQMTVRFLLKLAKEGGWSRHRPTAVGELRVEPFKHFVGELPPVVWVVQNMIQRGYVYALTAKWGAGKTAVALSLAMHVAVANAFAGLKVQNMRVLYCAGENPNDVRMRALAAARLFGMDADELSENLCFTNRAFNLTARQQALKLVDLVKTNGIGLVIIDTGVAHSAMQEENNNSEMHALAASLRGLSEALEGAAVVCLMHPPKDATRDTLSVRGGGAFAAEIDGELLLWQDQTTKVVELFHGTKLRGPGFRPIHFNLQRYEVPDMADNFGSPVDSVVAVYAGSIAQAKVRRESPAQRAALDALIEAGREHVDVGDNCELLGVHVDRWRAAYYRTSTADNPEAKRKAFQRARENLRGAGLVEVSDDHYTPTDGARREQLINAINARRVGSPGAAGHSETPAGHVPACPAPAGGTGRDTALKGCPAVPVKRRRGGGAREVGQT